MKGERKIQITVVGGRTASAGILKDAEEVGALLARRNAVVVCGGMGGVMEAACRGAKREGGLTVGILPTGDASDANDLVDIVIPTDLGVARNALVVNAGAGVIAVGGQYGTLSEIAFALQRGIPVVSLKSWHVDERVLKADTPEKAVETLFRAIGLT